MSSLPNLFLIGGMKCGSTTLYADLAQHPEIHAPAVKEPTFLERSELDDAGVAALYRELHRGGEGAAYRMDGSTRYSMRAQIPGAASRLRAICGPDCRIVYLVREPVARIVSQYRHAFSTGAIACGLAEALEREPALLDNSRYASQLAPWLEAFGEERIFVLGFEAYTADRRAACAAVLDFLGLRPLPADADLSGARNVSEGRRNPPKWFSTLSRSPFYKNRIAPLLPSDRLSGLKRVLYRKAPQARVDLGPELKARIRKELEDEIKALRPHLRFPANRSEVGWMNLESRDEG